MIINFDPAKSEWNRKLRSLPFERAGDLDWETAVYFQDNRVNYPETRIIALGLLGGRLPVVCFTPIDGGCADYKLSQGKQKGGSLL